MPIYSKSGKHYSHDYQYQQIKTLDQVDYTDEVIFYHHPYDKLQGGINLYDCLDEKNWQFLRDNYNVKLIHNNDSETFEIYFVNELVKTINERNIAPFQIEVTVMDENHKHFLEKHLIRQGIRGVKIRVSNYLLKTVVLPTKELPSTNKFSSLSRNYRLWRLYVYTELVRRDVIKNFNYSFHNIHPYSTPPTITSVSTMLEDLRKLGIEKVDQNVMEWLNQCPHELDLNNLVQDKWSNVTYDTILSTDFNLVIETHFDQKEYVFDNKEYSKDFSPSSITEKVYKPIACSKPFIVFSTPNYLSDLRNLGYKTFHPYINENYDSETNNTNRLNMIVDEIERICSLDEVTYKNLLDQCSNITKENLQVMLKNQNA